MWISTLLSVALLSPGGSGFTFSVDGGLSYADTAGKRGVGFALVRGVAVGAFLREDLALTLSYSSVSNLSIEEVRVETGGVVSESKTLVGRTLSILGPAAQLWLGPSLSLGAGFGVAAVGSGFVDRLYDAMGIDTTLPRTRTGYGGFFRVLVPVFVRPGSAVVHLGGEVIGAHTRKDSVSYGAGLFAGIQTL